MPWEVGAHRGGAERFGSVLQLGVGPLTRWTLRRKLGSVVRGRRLIGLTLGGRLELSGRKRHEPSGMTSAGRQAAKLPHVNWGLRSQLMS
ncbi:hypothetical protein B296_00019747 [Ensete ventricosum]|uniref:Uncharacterized protein n=1 Tax=Ensete ventricosum TaxID=4639 RepID=A0A427A731_ENSVE|nr:hypothetical protein B296_00019747 [Ensete ventricosum]